MSNDGRKPFHERNALRLRTYAAMAVGLVVTSLLVGGCSPVSKEDVVRYDAAVRAAVLAVPGVAGGSTDFADRGMAAGVFLTLDLNSEVPTMAQRLVVLDDALKAAAGAIPHSGMRSVFTVRATVRGGTLQVVSSNELRISNSDDLYRRFPKDFSPSKDAAKAASFEQRVREAVMVVPGVTGGSTTFADEGLDPGIWLRFSLTTAGTSRTQRVAILDQALRASAGILREAGIAFSVAGSVISGAAPSSAASSAVVTTAAELAIYSGTDLWQNFPRALVPASTRATGKPTASGVPLATENDALALTTQLAALPHVTGAYVAYRDQSSGRAAGSCLYLDTDLPQTGVDGAGTLTSPPFAQLVTQVRKVVWAQPFDVGETCLSLSTSGSFVVDAGFVSMYDLYKEFGRPPRDPVRYTLANPDTLLTSPR